MSSNLTAEKGMIFRITHRANALWILRNGLHCANSNVRDPRFVQIGNNDLIGRRRDRVVGPGEATLADYVPFYFTPWSPMLLNIVTGRGVPRQNKRDILILSSSIPRIEQIGIPYLISDRHAFVAHAQFSDNRNGLYALDWGSLQSRNFKRDPDDPGKFERYEAEALVLHHVPVEAIKAVYAYDDTVGREIQELMVSEGLEKPVHVNRSVFFG